MEWIADFETTSEKRKKVDNTTHVWAVGLCEVGNPENVVVLRTIDQFIEWCREQKTNDTIYFHNLRFDGNFIVQYLLRNGYKFAATPQEKESRCFTTLISDKSLWYQIEIFFTIKGKKVNKVTIQDSLKLIPLRVKEIAKSFHLPIKKGSIDYSAHDFLPEGSPLTPEEEEYLVHDVQIVEHAVNFFHSQGLDKMTIGACALEEFKRLINKKYFKMYFPPPFYDEDVRKAYKGGFTYLNPKFKNKTLGKMIVLDVNSLYPSVMAGCNCEIMPYGTPIFFDGEYEEDPLYPVYVQKIRCSFRIKPDKIPTIQIKGNMYYQGNEYLRDSDGEVTLYLTSVDLKLFFDHYEVFNKEFMGGWKFKGIEAGAIFGDYVSKWSATKIKSKEEGNHGMYLISKLFLNSLYGKFGSAVKVCSKEPYIGEDGKVHFRKSEEVEKEGVYIAMACFITAYARNKTIRAAQQITDDYNSGKSKIQFVYADTDSCHCVSPDGSLPQSLDIHPTKLGAWDHEATAVKAKFLRQKCYMEKHIISEKSYRKALEDPDTIRELYEKEGENYYFTKITVAGMPETCYKNVTFDNFRIGAKYPGKLAHRTVMGGVVLEDTDFTIKK